MAAYADYAFYTLTYLGAAIAQADFDRLALRASVVIDQVTYGRAAPVIAAGEDADAIEKIKLATCAVAEELQSQSQGGQIQSERVGQHSVTYNVGQATSEKHRLSEAAKLYLWSTDLMYRGFNADEQ